MPLAYNTVFSFSLFLQRNILSKKWRIMATQRLFREIRYWPPFCRQVDQFSIPVFTQSLPRLLPRWKAKRKGRKSSTADSVERPYDLFHSRGNGQAALDVGWVILYLLIVKYNPTGSVWILPVLRGKSRFNLSMRISPLLTFEISDTVRIVSSTHRV